MAVVVEVQLDETHLSIRGTKPIEGEDADDPERQGVKLQLIFPETGARSDPRGRPRCVVGESERETGVLSEPMLAEAVLAVLPRLAVAVYEAGSAEEKNRMAKRKRIVAVRIREALFALAAGARALGEAVGVAAALHAVAVYIAQRALRGADAVVVGAAQRLTLAGYARIS
jgi:hypothetical protein